MCDYTTGFKPPEMVKYRRVVVVSPRYNPSDLSARLALVVPVSTTPPQEQRPVHVRIPAAAYPFFHDTEDVWVKADMLSHVGFDRLDRLRIDGVWQDARTTTLSSDDFSKVQEAVLHALGLGRLWVPASAV